MTNHVKDRILSTDIEYSLSTCQSALPGDRLLFECLYSKGSSKCKYNGKIPEKKYLEYCNASSMSVSFSHDSSNEFPKQQK